MYINSDLVIKHMGIIIDDRINRNISV